MSNAKIEKIKPPTMHINISSNIDAELEKAKKLLEFYQYISSIKDAEDYYTPEQVAKILGCTVPSAREYMRRPDFPRIECGKTVKVNRLAFLLYNMERRVKNEH